MQKAGKLTRVLLQSAPLTMNFYVARDGESLGPYSEAQTREYLKTGIFTREDLGCPEGEQDWRPLAELLPPITRSNPTQQVQPRTVSKSPVASAQTNRQKPAWLVPMVAIAGLLALVAGWYFFLQPGTLKGEVFIVTRGGTNYRLALVPVSIYAYNDVKGLMLKKIDESSKRQTEIIDRLATIKDYPYSTEYSNLESEQEGLENGEALYESLPPPIASTQTDSEGRFVLPMPKHGTYLVAAKSQRMTGNTTEQYYWMVRESLDGSSEKTKMLSNDNLYSATLFLTSK